MPNRVLRDCTDSFKIKNISVHAERFFYRLIMKADDFGCFHADTSLLKANLFPLLLDQVREADIVRWMAECQKADLIVLYEVAKKQYLQILNFKQRLDKAKSRYPLPDSNPFPEVVANFPPETETESETETEEDSLPVDTGASEPVKFETPEKEYASLKKEVVTVVAFIRNNKPIFHQPYMDLWNLFATQYNLSRISKITDTRKKKLTIRLKDQMFDLIEILRKAKTSQFILTGNWFSFDWLLENESNYLKVLEGNFKNKTDPKDDSSDKSEALRKRQQAEERTAKLAAEQ